MTNEIVWVTVGNARVRADHIIMWEEGYVSGAERHLYVTLTSGTVVDGKLDREQWVKFADAIGLGVRK
jgi:hypothetical protein